MGFFALLSTPPEGVGFLRDLAVVLCVAAITALVFQRLRQPVVLGYLLAGVIVGPHVTPQLVSETTNVRTLSELGVILVMYSIGLELSLRRLLRLGPVAGLVTALEVGAMLWLGFSCARLFGWSTLESVFVAAALAVSSTMILSKSFEETSLSASTRSLAFGITVFEDLVAVLLLAGLTTVVSAGGDLTLAKMGGEVLRLSAFLALILVAGLLVVPRVLRTVVALRRDETTTVACVGLSFALALLALLAGYSVALGAFLAGLLSAESGHARHLERLVQPVRDVFAAIFFVSIGMLVDPALVLEHWLPVIVLTAVVVLGKTATVTLGGFLAGQGVRNSFQAGLGVAQIGEFAFLIAGLGVAVGATSPSLPAVAVAVATLTNFLSPVLVRSSRPLAAWLEAHLPRSLQTVEGLWGGWLERLREARPQRSGSSPTRRLVGIVLLDAVLVLAVLAAGSRVRAPLTGWLSSASGLPAIVCWAAIAAFVLLAATPFLLGIVRAVRKLGAVLGHQALPAPESGFDPAAAPRRVLVASLQLALLLVVGLPLAAILQPLWPEVPLVPLFALGMVPAGIGFWRSANDLLGHVRAGAQIVVEALARESASPESHALDQAQALLPGLGDLESLRLTNECPAVGRTLGELDLRGSSGATVLAVQRGEESIAFPDGSLPLRAGDVLALSGSRGALEIAHSLLAGTSVPRRARPSAEGGRDPRGTSG